MNLAEFIEGRRDQHLAELCELLRIPSVSAKSEHKPDIERGARWVADNLRAAGFKTVEIVPTNLHPLVYAESLEAPANPRFFSMATMTCSPPSLSISGPRPLSNPPCAMAISSAAAPPTTSQVHIHLKALESLEKVNGKLPINVKVLIEGEEEVGSVSLWDYVQKNKEKLKADALIVSDTSMLGKGVPSIPTAARLELLPD